MNLFRLLKLGFESQHEVALCEGVVTLLARNEGAEGGSWPSYAEEALREAVGGEPEPWVAEGTVQVAEGREADEERGWVEIVAEGEEGIQIEEEFNGMNFGIFDVENRPKKSKSARYEDLDTCVWFGIACLGLFIAS